MRNKRVKPNFRVKHPYGYLIKSMLIGLVLVFTSIFSMATGVVNLKPSSNADAAVSGNWSDSTDAVSTYNPSLSTKGFASGNGTKSSPFTINTIAQWRCFSDFVKNWNGGYKYYFQLGADLDFSGHYFDANMAVGYSGAIQAPSTTKATSASATDKSFAGVFYGNGYRIMNVTVKEGYEIGGLFGSMCGTAYLSTGESAIYYPNYSETYYSPAVYDLVIENMTEESGACGDAGFGAVTGIARRAVISNVFVYSTTNGKFECGIGANIGGIAGCVYGCQIYGCKVDGMTLYGNGGIGGIVGVVGTGYESTYIVNCHNNATVQCGNGSKCWGAGGIVGSGTYASGSHTYVKYCWNTGLITSRNAYGSSSTNGSHTDAIKNGGIAGLVGYGVNTNLDLIIQYSYNAGDVYVNSYQNGTLTKVKATYGLAKNYYGHPTYMNYYDNTKTTSGGSNTSSETGLSTSSLMTNISTESTGIGYTSAGHYVRGNDASGGYCYPLNSQMPVSTLSGNSINKASGDVSYWQIGATVAKKIYISKPSTINITPSYTCEIFPPTQTATSIVVDKVPSKSYASSLTITGNAGKAMKIEITKYSQKGVVSTTSELINTGDLTTAPTYSMSFNKYDLFEYKITVTEFAALEGSGTNTNPYLIHNINDLEAMTNYDTNGVYFGITNNITIDSSASASGGFGTFLGEFSGMLDGRGHTINITNDDVYGLFAQITSNGIVHNLNIVKQTLDYSHNSTIQCINDSTQGGLLTIYNYGIVDNVSVYIHDVTFNFSDIFAGSDLYCGVLTAINYGTISNCYVGGVDASRVNLENVDFPRIYINSDASDPSTMMNTGFRFGSMCAQNGLESSLVGNSASLEIYNNGANGNDIRIGGITGDDNRDDQPELLMSDNFFEGGFDHMPSDGSSYVGGICGHLSTYMSEAKILNTTLRNITRLTDDNTTNSNVDAMFGYCETDVSSLNLAYTSAHRNLANASIATYTDIISSGFEFSGYESITGSKFDPKYWIAIGNNESKNKTYAMNNYQGDIYYPRSKKLLRNGSEVDNNWVSSGSSASTASTVSISTGYALGNLAAGLNAGTVRNLTTINITADLYLYGSVWSPIDTLSGVTINGNGHTIYGLYSIGSTNDVVGGLIRNASNVTVNNLNFEDCMLNTPYFARETLYMSFVAGGANNFSANNVEFRNCHILVEPLKNTSSYATIMAGFLFASDDTVNTIDDIRVTSDSADVTLKSTITLRDENNSVQHDTYVGGIFGAIYNDTATLTNIDINGLDFNIIGFRGYSTVYGGGIGGLASEVVNIKKANIVSLSFNVNPGNMWSCAAVGGVVGCVGSEFYISDSIIDPYIYLPRYDCAGETSILFGGVVGTQANEYTVVCVDGCDLNLAIMGVYANIIPSDDFVGIGGVVGGGKGVLKFEDNVLQFKTNLINHNLSPKSVFTIRGGDRTDSIDVNRNLIILDTNDNANANGSNNTSASANVVYCTNGDLVSLDILDIGTTSYNLDQMIDLANGNSGDQSFNDHFFGNKFVRQGYNNDSDPYVRKYNENDTNLVVPTYNNNSVHYRDVFTLAGFGFTVYNVLDPNSVTKINATNSLGASNNYVTITRNAQYTLPYESNPNHGFIYLAYGDTLKFTLNNSAYKYSAVWQGKTGSTIDNSSLLSITSQTQSDTTIDVTNNTIISSNYWKGYKDGTNKFLNINVNLAQNQRYFAVHSSMSVTGATYYATRGNYKVYFAAHGTQITVTKSGNTIGYSTNTSDTSYIEHLGRGTINANNNISNITLLTPSSSSISLNGYYKYAFTVNDSNTSTTNSAGLITYTYITAPMYKHTIAASGDTDGAGGSMSTISSGLYFITNLTGSTQYTTLMLKEDVAVKYTYPTKIGEWTYSNVTRSGNVASSTTSGYNYDTTLSNVNSTIKYLCNTYYTTLYTYQEAASFEDQSISKVPISGNGTTASGVPTALWGGWSSSLKITTYSSGSESTVTVSSINGYNGMRKGLYLTYGGKNYVGAMHNDSFSLQYESVIVAVKYNTTISMTATLPAGYKLGEVGYTANGSTVAATVSGTTIKFTVKGGGTLEVNAIQDKWDDHISTPSGSGTASSPYLIASAANFGWMVNKINSTDTSYASKYYTLSADIDLAGKYVSPIKNTFTGTFTGGSSTVKHTIKNLKIWANESANLFANNAGTIRNILFLNPTISSTTLETGLVAANSGTIENFGAHTSDTSTAFVSGSGSQGFALIGENYGTVSSVFNTAKIYSYGFVAGVIGANYYIAKNIYSNFSYTTIAGNNDYVAALVSTNSNGAGSGKTATISNAYTAVNLGSSYTKGYLYQSNASGSTIKNVYYLSGAFAGTPTNSGTATNVVAKTADQLKDSNQYISWDDFGANWKIVAKDTSTLYNGQPKTGYPLLTMGDASGMVKISLRYSIKGLNGNVWDGNSDVPGWTASPYTFWVTPGKSFTKTISKSTGTYPTPVYLHSLDTYSGFSSTWSISATNKSSTNTFTVSAAQCAFTSGTTEAVLQVTFEPPTATFNSNVDGMISGATLVTGVGSKYAKHSTSTTDTTAAATFTYGINSNYNPLIFERFAVGGATILSGHLTTATTKYIYLSGSTYSANASKNGTGTYVGTVKITPSSTKAGTITLSELKENITITATMYQGIQISYSGLVSGTANTISSYYNTSAITTGTTSTKIADVRKSGGAASATAGTYYIPVKSGSSRILVGSVLKGNTSSYTYYQGKHNNTVDFTNTSYASVADKAHSLTAAQMNGFLNTTADHGTLSYTYGPGQWTYTISIKSLHLTTKPTTITINDSVSNTSKSFSGDSIAANKTVTFSVKANVTPKFEISYTVASGKVYRTIWGSDASTGMSSETMTADSATQNRTYYINVIERFKATLSASKNNTNGGRTYISTNGDKQPVLTITYSANANFNNSASGSVSNSGSATQSSVTTNQYIDYGSKVTYAKGDRTVDSTNKINFSHIYGSGTLSKSSTASITANDSATASYNIVIHTVTTKITNKDLTLHPDVYIGITRNGNYTFDESTMHTTNSAKTAYYIYYAGLTASTGSGDNVTRGHRTFYVVGGELVQARRWDLKSTGYANDIASVTHTNSSNTSTEVKEGGVLLLGIDFYVKGDDTVSFTYYPLVEVNLARTANTTSIYATNNKDTLLPVATARATTSNIFVKGTKTQGGTYAYSTIESNQNVFEPIVYMQLSYRVPTSSLTGWNFNGWAVGSTSTIIGSSAIGGITYTQSVDTTSESGYTIYKLTFTLVKQSTSAGSSITNFQYYIIFTEKTYSISVNTNLTSGGATAVNNAVANKALYEYTNSSYTESSKTTRRAAGTSAISYTAGYYGYYKITQTSVDANNYEYASGDNNKNVYNRTSAYASTATYKKWHTINDPTITIDYHTSTYTDNQYNRTVDGNVYTFYARKTSDSANGPEIAKITLSGITVKDNVKKVLEGATLTVSYTTNTNKFRCATAPASKTIIADTTITGAFAENVINFYFYKNTDPENKLNSTAVTLGTLNEAYSIPSTYQATPGDEYVFAIWTTNGNLKFDNASTLATYITALSINGANGATVSIYANWRRVYYHTWGTAIVNTTHTTTSTTCAGGTVSVTAPATAANYYDTTSKKYSYQATATVGNSVVAGHKFVSYNPSNATISGTTATRTGSSYTISNNKIKINDTTYYYIKDKLLFVDENCRIGYSAYDYAIGSTCTIYDKASATVGATFAELTYTLTVTQVTGFNITIDSNTSTGTVTNASKPTAIVLGYFSKLVLKCTTTSTNVRFSGWTVADSTAFTNTITTTNMTITLGPNVVKNTTVTVNSVSQRKIANSAFIIRYLTSDTATYPPISPNSISTSGNTIIYLYDNFAVTYVSSKEALQLIDGNMYAVTNGDTITATIYLTSVSGITIPKSGSAVWYKFTTPSNESTWSATSTVTNIPSSGNTTGFKISGSSSSKVTVTFPANTTALPKAPSTANTLSWGIKLYQTVEGDDHTSSNNSKVYVVNPNTPSVKVLEGTQTTLVANDYEDSSAKKTYKFSHWTFVPSDSEYSSNADWISATDTNYKNNKQFTFKVYANRAGVYTAHYKYAYGLTTATRSTTNGSSFTSVASATLTGSAYTHSNDSKYLAGSSVTVSATLQSGYVYYGWYLLSGSTYTAITTSTTGVTALSSTQIKFTVGGKDCDGGSISGINLETYTIVFAARKLITIKFGTDVTSVLSATYTLTSAGINSATDGNGNALTKSNNAVSCTLAAGKFMTVYLLEGSEFTLKEEHTAGSYRTLGILYGSSSDKLGTLQNSGLTGVILADRDTSQSGTYKVVFTPVYTLNPTLAVSATHVTTDAELEGTPTITVTPTNTANKGYKYNGVTYYDDGTSVTITATIPTGYSFTSLTIDGYGTYTDNPKTITLTKALTGVTLNISELQYDISTVVKVNIPAKSLGDGASTPSSATTWTSSGFGSLNYSSNHKSSQTLVGYFGTVSGLGFASLNKLYVSNSKLYYDSEHTHEVDANLYTGLTTSAVTFMGTSYTVSGGVVTIPTSLYTMYVSPSFATSTGTLSGTSITGIHANITITVTAKMNVIVKQDFASNKDRDTLTGGTASTKVVNLGGTASITASTISGYVFKGWQEYRFRNGALTRITAAGSYYSTATTISVTAFEQRNGSVFRAVYAPLYSLTVDASTFSQGSVTVKVGSGTAETLTAKKTYSNIEYGTTISLTATASGQNRVNYWAVTNDGASSSTYNNAVSFNINGTTTATHHFLTQYNIVVNHSVAAGGTWTIQEYVNNGTVAAPKWEWQNVTDTNFVNASGSKTYKLADGGIQYRVVVTTKTNYKVVVSASGMTNTISGTNNANVTSGTATTTVTFNAMTTAGTVTITHTGLSYISVSTAPSGLNNTVKIDSTSGTETIAKTTVVAGNHTLTTTAVSGYGTPTWYNGNTKITSGVSTDGLTLTLSSTTVGTTYNIIVKYSSTNIALTVEGYTDSISYASVTGTTTGSYTTVSHNYSPEITLTNSATGVSFKGFNANKHISMALYAGSTVVATVTSDTAISYTLPVGSEVPALRLVFVNKTWIDSGAYTAPSGTGTAADPYKIASAANLAWVSYSSATGNNFAGKYFLQSANIDLSSRLWVPIQNFNGIYNGANYSINGLNCVGEKYNITAHDSLTSTIISGLNYSVGSLVYASNGGVFKNIAFGATTTSSASTTNNVSTLAGSLIATATNVVVDKVVFGGTKLSVPYFVSGGLLIGKLTGGKITNIGFNSSAQINDSGISGDKTNSGTSVLGGLIGETTNGTTTYYDCNGGTANVVIENINLPVASKNNSSCTAGGLIGKNSAKLRINNVYRGNSLAVIGSDTASSTTVSTNVVANGGASTVKTLYEQGANPWYYISSSKYGLNIDATNTTTSIGTVTASATITLGSSTTIGQFEKALSLLASDSTVTKVLLDANLDFGGASMTNRYNLPEGKTFDGQGHTVKGISTIADYGNKGGIWNTVNGTIKRVAFENIYAKFEARWACTIGYSHMGLVAGYVHGGSLTNVTVKNSRIDYSFDGVVGSSSNGTNVGTIVGAFDSNPVIKDVESYNCKLNYSQYGVSTSNAMDISGFAPYLGGASIQNLAIDTDMVVQGSYTSNYVSGIGGYRSAITLTNGYFRGNVYSNMLASRISPIAYLASTVTNAFASGTFSTKSATAKPAGNSGTFTNVYISSNASSVSGTVTDANLKTQSTFSGFNFTKGTQSGTLQWTMSSAYGYTDGYPHFSIPSNSHKVTVVISGTGASANTLYLGNTDTTNDVHGDVTMKGAATYSRLYWHDLYSVLIHGTLLNGYYIKAGIDYTYVKDENGNKTNLLENDIVGEQEVNLSTDITNALKNTNGSIIDGTVYITIEKSNYAVTASSDGHGTVSGAGTYAFGSSITLKATPNANTDNYHAHRFVAWYKDGKQVSTNASYTFTMSETTAGAYTAKFCGSTNNECNYKATASTTNSSTTVSPTDTGWILGGKSRTFTITLGSGQEITSITRTNKDSASATTVYTKTEGAISGYTYASNKLTFTLNNTTRGAYSFVVGATSSNVIINIPNVGMTERGDTGSYSAHGDITLTTGSTTSTIGASATTGKVAVIYNNNLTITFMSNVRYKLGSVSTTQSGAGTTFTTATSTVGGYTRYTYTYTTSAVTADCTITLNLVKDRWVDFTQLTGADAFSAGHSAEFTTANGGNASYEISGSASNPTYGTDQRYKGMAGNPIVISTAAQLARVSYLISSDKVFYHYASTGSTVSAMYYGEAYYVISADIDLGNYFWTPINQNESSTRAYSISSMTQRTISNMYVRFDKEEYVLNGNQSVKNSCGFISNFYGSITGLTFDNAHVYDTQTGSASICMGVVAGYGTGASFNFITVKNSTIEAAGYLGGITGVAYYRTSINNCNSINNTFIGLKDNTNISEVEVGGITAYCYDSGINGASVSGFKTQYDGTKSVVPSAFVNGLSNATINNVVVKSASSSGTGTIYLRTFSRMISKNSSLNNVWTYNLTNAYSADYGSHTINVLPSSPTVSALGLSADLWYVSSNIPYLKTLGASNGTTTVAKIADVTTGTFSGSGTKDSPYLIDTAAKFRYLTYLVNANNSTYNASTVYYKLTADIDLSGGFSTVLGKSVDSQNIESGNKFKAHLDGDFHTISNMLIFETYSKFVGFIGYTDSNATVKNLNLDKITIIGAGAGYVGGVIGYGYLGVNIDNVNVTNAYISNNIGADGNVGGLVGLIRTSSSTSLSTNITNSGFDGTIVAYSGYVGGIVGNAQYANNTEVMTIDSCHTSGQIIASYNSTAGGILGGVSTMSSYANESVNITNCYNDATINFISGQIGGIAGYTNNVTIENCYNNGVLSGYLFLTVNTSSANYNTDANWNNGSVSINKSYAVFVAEIIGRNYDNTSNTTKISNSYFANTAQIVIENWTTTCVLLPYGNSSITAHTEKGYSVWTFVSGGTTISSKAPTGVAEKKDDTDMKSPSTFAGWNTTTSWYSVSGSVPVHRWDTQNRLYFEGSNLSIGTDSSGNKVVNTDNGMIKFASGVVPVSDTDGRIYVYVAGSSLSVTFAPDTNFVLSSASTREYYGTSYSSILSGSTLTYNISFNTYSDGTSFKVLKASFINNKFTITVNTSLTRGTGISIGEYETLHIVIVNHTTNEAYSATLDDGTYVFDNLKAGTYYVAIYTTMFFNVSSASCTESKVNFTESDFYYTLVLSNNTSPNATISIVATKTVDAWIYSKLEVGA